MASLGTSKNSLGVNPWVLKRQQEIIAKDRLVREKLLEQPTIMKQTHKGKKKFGVQRRFPSKGVHVHAQDQAVGVAVQVAEVNTVDDQNHPCDVAIEMTEELCIKRHSLLVRVHQISLMLNLTDVRAKSDFVLPWVQDPGSDTDIEEIPTNPEAYDTPVGDSLPFNFDKNILLAARNSDMHRRKFLWLCLTTQSLFWLVGCVPDSISTWRESMLRHCKYIVCKKQGIQCADTDETVLFGSAKQFSSKSATMEDIQKQTTRAAGVKQNRKRLLAVDNRATTPQISGIRRIESSVRPLSSGQRVICDITQQHFKMGSGCLVGPVIPLKVSVAQVCESISALNHASPPDCFPPGCAIMTEAMMDVDNAIFGMTADTVLMREASTVQEVIKLLQGILPVTEQNSNVLFVPSGEWQRIHKTGPTIRPVNGGNWWKLPSPKHTREPCRLWLHSPEFFDFSALKILAIEVANELFEVYDAHNPERMTKLRIENTHDELKIPGGFIFSLVLGTIACRIGEKVTIFFETFSNKSYGMKLDALKPPLDNFGDDTWAYMVENQLFTKLRYSIVSTLIKLTDPSLGCFFLNPAYVSIGFGFSTSYCDSRYCSLYSVCKHNNWRQLDEHESFCTMALHESMCPHTTHFKEGPILRVQSYIESFNCITDRQCGSGKTLYSPIGFSALDKVASGELNISAVLEGLNDELSRVNNAMITMSKHPRNRTEIQVRCIVDSTGRLNWKSMIETASSVIICSTQHWPLDHVLSFSSLNAAAMYLIAQQSWRLACDVNIKMTQRQNLLDIGSGILKRWKSFKTGSGQGTTGPKNSKRLVDLPKLSDTLLSNLSTLSSKGKSFLCIDDEIEIFSQYNVVSDDSFCVLMNERIERNRNSSSTILSRYVIKCCTCGELFYGSSNGELLDFHHQENPSCLNSDWSDDKEVTAINWEADYKRRISGLSEFLKSCSKEQADVCESVFKFGSGILAVGIAGSGKSVALNRIGEIMECIFYEPGELVRCAATGLLAQYFHSCANTVHSAIGAYPDFGQAPNWNLSVHEWRSLLENHGKVTSTLKVFINTEVYAQSSNMLQALFEIRKDKQLRFLPILDGDPPQPMHEDDTVSDAQANVTLCGINDHFLLQRDEIHRLLPDARVVLFDTPLRQKDAKVHELSHAVRYAKAEIKHVQQMRDNEFDPQKHFVDIILCALKKDSMSINYNNMKALPGKEYIFLPKHSTLKSPSRPLILKIGAPVIFTKAYKGHIIGKTGRTRNIVNGTRGIVESCDARCEFVNIILSNTKVNVRVEAIPIDGAGFSQIPVQLGWATTIKKAGGMTFDTVAIDFGLDWSLDEMHLIQCSKASWRISQVYGAITRSRNLAYFCHASKFKNAPMLALLNNQNITALDFLARLHEFQDRFVRTHQDARCLSFIDDSVPSGASSMKRTAPKSLVLTFKSLDSDIKHHIIANKYPHTFARQAAGTYFTGMMMSSKSEKVLLKKTCLYMQQPDEILALRSLSGTLGVPNFMGTAGEYLVLSHNGEAPHQGPLQEAQLIALSLIINAIHDRGWTFTSISRENIWTCGNLVTLFNYENAVQMSNCNRRITIHDFTTECNSNCHTYMSRELQSTTGHPFSYFDLEDQDDHIIDIDDHDINAHAFVFDVPTLDDNDEAASILAPAVTLSAATAKSLLDVKNVNFDTFEPSKGSKRATLTQVSNWLADAIEALKMPKFLCKHHGSADTYGEATPALVKYMLAKYKDCRDEQLESQSSFVDLGSGHGGLVDAVAVLMRFGTCFGVELERKRASFAYPLAELFFDVVRRKNVRYSKVEIIVGDFLKCDTTKNILKHARLVWINNVKFAAFNYQILTLLDEYVPAGCIVVSFETLLSRRHNSGFIVISEDDVAGAADWTSRPQKVYVIRKQK